MNAQSGPPAGGVEPPGAAASAAAGPEDFAWLLEEFLAGTPGARQVVVVSVDGMLLATAGDVARDVADPMAAVASGLVSLADNAGGLAGTGVCQYLTLRMPAGHVLAMRIDAERDRPGTAIAVVVAGADADLRVVAHQMGRVFGAGGSAARVLTPELGHRLRAASPATGAGEGGGR